MARGTYRQRRRPFWVKGEKVVRMLFAAGTGGAVGANTGLTHLGQRTFEGRPQWEEFIQEALLNQGTNIFRLHKRECNT